MVELLVCIPLVLWAMSEHYGLLEIFIGVLVLVCCMVAVKEYRRIE